jgi:putative toxin-antitoxin system antitoxin component (TIGR02293 family)
MYSEGSLRKVKSDVPISVEREVLMNQLDTELRNIIKNLDIEETYSASFKEMSFTDFLNNKLFIVFLIRNGIPYSFFSLIKKFTPFSLNDWADYLDISRKSLIRYQNQDKAFKPIHTEKIIELAEVTKIGQEVFGNDEKFRLWLETPNFALGNLKPFDLLKDSYGKELLIAELTRIEHGILS